MQMAYVVAVTGRAAEPSSVYLAVESPRLCLAAEPPIAQPAFEHECSNDEDEDEQRAINVKRAWTEAEDKMLVEVVEKFGAQRWSLIASHMAGRIGKQCRERWFNHLCSSVKKGEWTFEEDLLIEQGVSELGTRWSEIVKRLSGRTDNAIKNRFNSNQRRQQRMQRRALTHDAEALGGGDAASSTDAPSPDDRTAGDAGAGAAPAARTTPAAKRGNHSDGSSSKRKRSAPATEASAYALAAATEHAADAALHAEGTAKQGKPRSRKAAAAPLAAPLESPSDLSELQVDLSGDANSQLLNLEAAAHRKRQRILQLATQLAGENEDGERRDSIIQLLMRETKQSARLATAMKDFPTWQLNGGTHYAHPAFDGGAPSSPETDALPLAMACMASPAGGELEAGVDPFVQRFAAADPNNELSNGPSTSSSSISEASRGAAAGLKLDLRLLDGTSTGEVLGTAGLVSPSNMVSPMGTMGTGFGGLGLTPILAHVVDGKGDDWFAAYGQQQQAVQAADKPEPAESGAALLSPLTPSKSLTTLVDAF